MTLREKATLAAFNKAVDIGFKKIKKNPREGMLDIVGIMDKFMMPKSEQENSGKKAIENIRREFADPNSSWVSFATDMVNDVDENVIKHFVSNVGFNAAYRGNKKRCKLQREENCNIPWAILFDPTSACNLKCTGCWAAEYGHKNNLSYDEMASIIKQGNDIGTYMYILTGGEPLVRKDDIIKLAEEFNDSEFHIFTNGTLIDEKFCKEVQRVGNISFAISIEGTEESTDSRRGKGVYKRVMDSMKLLQKHHLLYGVSICYTSVNYKYVTDDEFIMMLREHGCKLAWYFHYMPVGNDADPSLMPNASQRKHVMDKVHIIRSKDYANNMFAIDFQNDGEYIGGCIAGGRNYFHINSAGDMEPCVFIHYSDSNIRKDTIMEALKKPLFMAYHHNQPFNSNHLKPCPMLENPGRLSEMVNDSGAHSTDMISPESAEHLENKCKPYAKQWNATAEAIWSHRKHNKGVY